MENSYSEELRRKLESGEISQGLYDEIMKRWGSQESKTEEEKEQFSENDQAREGTTSISGSGHLSNVISEILKISGSGHVSGYVDVDTMKVSGSGHVEGNISVSGELETSGSLASGGSIKAGSIDSSGSLKAQSIKAENIDSSGSLRVDGDIEAQTMDISGSCVAENVVCDDFECSGMLKAKTLKGSGVEISGGIRVDSVECDSFYMSIDTSTNRNTIGKLICTEAKIETRRRFFKSSVEIDELVCKEADLESVKAKKVVGDEVVVGNGCEIDYVEARVLKTSGDAVIREKKILE